MPLRHAIARPSRRLFLALCASLLLGSAVEIRAEDTLPDFTPRITAASALAARVHPLWLDALIAAEDPGFRKHPVAASTITATVAALLVRETTAGASPTRARSLAMGATLALGLSASHDEVLCLLLQHASFGHAATGHDTAARIYFRKGADELTLPEIASLVALIEAPVHLPEEPERARARRDQVLHGMRAAGSISEAELQSALAAPLGWSR